MCSEARRLEKCRGKREREDVNYEGDTMDSESRGRVYQEWKGFYGDQNGRRREGMWRKFHDIYR